MKHSVLPILGMAILLTSCGKDEPVSYQVPKQPPQAAPTPPMGTDADNQAVMAAHATMSAQLPSTGFTADTPANWTEKVGSGMRKASYSIAGTSIDFYLITLSMGDVPSNVNRWRGQVGLPPATPEEIASEVQTFKAGGHDVSYIEVYNEEGGKGIIAAIIDLSPSYWYFTGKGSVDELKANAADMQSFLKSMKFEGHDH